MSIRLHEDIEQTFKLAQVKEITNLGKTTIYEMMAEGTFPKSKKVHKNSVIWKKSDLEQWLEDPENYRSESSNDDGSEV